MACVPEMAALESAFFTVLPQESQRDFPWFAPKMCLFNFTSSFSSASVQVERLLYWLLQPSVTSRCAQRCFPLTWCPNLRCAWSYSCRYSNHLTGRLTYRTGHTGTLKSAHQWVVSTSFWNLHREFSEKCMVHIACPRGRLTLGSWYWRLCLSCLLLLNGCLSSLSPSSVFAFTHEALFIMSSGQLTLAFSACSSPVLLGLRKGLTASKRSMMFVYFLH